MVSSNTPPNKRLHLTANSVAFIREACVVSRLRAPPLSSSVVRLLVFTTLLATPRLWNVIISSFYPMPTFQNIVCRPFILMTCAPLNDFPQRRCTTSYSSATRARLPAVGGLASHLRCVVSSSSSPFVARAAEFRVRPFRLCTRNE